MQFEREDNFLRPMVLRRGARTILLFLLCKLEINLIDSLEKFGGVTQNVFKRMLLGALSTDPSEATRLVV